MKRPWVEHILLAHELSLAKACSSISLQGELKAKAYSSAQLAHEWSSSLRQVQTKVWYTMYPTQTSPISSYFWMLFAQGFNQWLPWRILTVPGRELQNRWCLKSLKEGQTPDILTIETSMIHTAEANQSYSTCFWHLQEDNKSMTESSLHLIIYLKFQMFLSNSLAYAGLVVEFQELSVSLCIQVSWILNSTELIYQKHRLQGVG